MTATAPSAPLATPSADRIGVGELAAIIDDYIVDADQRTYPLVDRAAWPAVAPGALTDDQISALRFITFIEDHTPGYLADYQRLFPLEPGLPEDILLYNRELHRFTVRWAVDEERHADLLGKYQVHAGLTTADELRRQLIREAVKPFHLAQREHVAAVVAYTVIQEKATQIFYRRFQDQLAEPLLGRLLAQLGRDESRHFALFARVLEACVRAAPIAAVDAIKEVLFHFKMPLSDSLRGYWRWAVRITDAMGYDHTEAYQHLVRLVERTADASVGSRTADLTAFIEGIRAVS